MGEELMNVQPNGTVTFANEVLETIAGIAVADVPGIANMSGSLVKDGWNDLIGKKRPAKGVKAVSYTHLQLLVRTGREDIATMVSIAGLVIVLLMVVDLVCLLYTSYPPMLPWIQPVVYPMPDRFP